MEMVSGDDSRSHSDRLLLVDDVAKLLGVSKAAVYNMRIRGEIPYLKIGSRLRFDPKEIEKWLDAKKAAVA